MKSEFRVQVLSVLAIVISITALTIGFAAFSSTLTIDGSAVVENTSWNVHFESLSSAIIVGNAEATTDPTINTNTTSVSSFDIALETPGDSVSYTFNVVNSGTYNAIISEISIPTPACTGTDITYATTDANNVSSNLSYTLTYENGTSVAKGDTLNAGESKQLVLKLEYKEFNDSTKLPNSNVDITNLQISIQYAQN